MAMLVYRRVIHNSEEGQFGRPTTFLCSFDMKNLPIGWNHIRGLTAHYVVVEY